MCSRLYCLEGRLLVLCITTKGSQRDEKKKNVLDLDNLCLHAWRARRKAHAMYGGAQLFCPHLVSWLGFAVVRVTWFVKDGARKKERQLPGRFARVGILRHVARMAPSAFNPRKLKPPGTIE